MTMLERKCPALCADLTAMRNLVCFRPLGRRELEWLLMEWKNDHTVPHILFHWSVQIKMNASNGISIMS